jgi:hypothetical protein
MSFKLMGPPGCALHESTRETPHAKKGLANAGREKNWLMRGMSYFSLVENCMGVLFEICAGRSGGPVRLRAGFKIFCPGRKWKMQRSPPPFGRAEPRGGKNRDTPLVSPRPICYETEFRLIHG